MARQMDGWMDGYPDTFWFLKWKGPPCGLCFLSDLLLFVLLGWNVHCIVL